MKMRALHTLGLTGLFYATLVALPGSALANSQISQGVNKSGSPALVIDDITCKGNDTTECSFITKKYYQQRGDVVDPDEIADAKLRLGTLIQFRDVNIHLEKGHERGHVVVVFDVHEASNIQYEVNTGYHRGDLSNPNACGYGYSSDGTSSKTCGEVSGFSNDFSLLGGITDFNFLGSGKRLSVSLSGSKNNSNTSYALKSYTGTNSVISSSSSDSNHHAVNISVDYYDPHLFDSTHYYWRARLSTQKVFSKFNVEFNIDGMDTQQSNDSVNTSYTPNHIEFGRRFGSHSYVSVDTDQVLNGPASNNDNWFGINYGWDSQDDTLFATQGSAFTSRFRYGDFNGSNISLSYKKNHSIAHNEVLTWGLNTSVNRINNRNFFMTNERLNGSRNTVATGLSIRYTNINDINPEQGVYSGWFTDFSLSGVTRQRESDNVVSYAFKAGYTHQTDSLIYRFTLGYSAQENF